MYIIPTANGMLDSVHRQGIDDESVITIEDYQQNLEIEYSENPTSMAYSSNKTTVALYPIVLEYKIDDAIYKSAIAFLSDDKLHDMQQVSEFEKRMFEILRSKIPNKIENWERWSDGCGHEFRSRFCNAELMKMTSKLNLKKVSWEYFEAHEGKNVSDALGSIIKTRLSRKLLEHAHGVRSAAEIVSLLDDCPQSTEKFTFLVTEEFKPFERIPAAERSVVVFPNILKTHSIKIVNNGLLAREQTCTICLPSMLCEMCKKTPPTVVTVDNESESDDESELGERVYGREEVEDDPSDNDDEDDDETIECPGFSVWQSVWAKYYGTWYPAKIVTSNVLPPQLKKRLMRCDTFVPVQWYGEETYSLVQQQNIDNLAQNRCDDVRAAVSEDMLVKYNLALADVNND